MWHGFSWMESLGWIKKSAAGGKERIKITNHHTIHIADMPYRISYNGTQNDPVRDGLLGGVKKLLGVRWIK